jgi:undecaprenyl-diphosphatase
MPITRFDASVRDWVLHHQNEGVRAVFQAVSTVCAPNKMIALAFLVVLLLWWKGRRLAAGSLLVAPLGTIATTDTAKDIYERARPAGGYGPHDYSFPSAHATASTAVCCAVAYVLWQERIVPGAFAVAFAVLVPLVVGASRVYLDVHWTTDVLAGWGFGLGIAAVSIALARVTWRARA